MQRNTKESSETSFPTIDISFYNDRVAIEEVTAE